MAPIAPIVPNPTTAAVLRLHAKRQHGRRKNKERAGPCVDGLEQKPEQHHPANVKHVRGFSSDEQSEIENQKNGGAAQIEEPVAKGWRDSAPDE